MIDFTPTQNRTIAAGITAFSLALVLAFVAAVGYGILRFLDFVSPALIPVILGIFLAMFFKPYYGWYHRRVRSAALAFALMSVSILIPLGIVLWLCGAFLFDQVTALVHTAPTILTRVSAWVQQTFPNAQRACEGFGASPEQLLFFTDPAKYTQDVVAQFSSTYGLSAVKAGVGALRYLTTVGTGLITLIFFVFFLMRPSMSGADYVRFAPFLKPETRAFIVTQIDAFLDIVVSFFQRQVVICLLEGLLYGTGFALVGLPYGFVLGFLLGAMNLVPLLGTICILPLALPYAFFGDGGSLLRLLGVTGVWACGQILDGYLITPMIQGNKTGLGFAGVIFSFVFWGAVFHSLLGLLLAIPLSAFCVVLWRALKSRYIKGVI